MKCWGPLDAGDFIELSPGRNLGDDPMFIAGGRHCHAGTPYTRGWELLAGLWAKMAESAILFTLMKLREWARKQGMRGARRDLSFCARLYGRRLARNRAERAVEALQCALSKHSASS